MQGDNNISRQAVAESRFSGGGYVFFRLPRASTYHYMAQKAFPEHLDSLPSWSGKSGYVVAPFHPHPTTPTLLIAPDVHDICETPTSLPDYHTEITACRDGRAEYAQAFAHCHKLLQNNVCEKIVLSRRMQFEVGCAPNPTMLFLNACLTHPNHYVALWWTAETGLWLVATPEVLLESDDHRWYTMALAGTEAWENQQAVADIERWSNKNRHEQQLVADEVARCLQPYADSLEASPTYPCRAGNVMHLRTDFSFTLRTSATPYHIIKDLHPTPAVCGVPHHEALRAILQAEAEPRRYYAGFSGMLTPKGSTHFYVSLRCLSMNDTSLTLYAGGGLLRSSCEAEEWEETERKLQTMLQVLRPQVKS